MRDDYAAEARDEHVTKLDNVLYIIIALVNIKTSKYLSKTNEVQTMLEIGEKKNTIPPFLLISWNSIYGKNNGYMVVGEIPEFFLFPKRDISTERCKCTIYIFIYKDIKAVIRTEFINMTVLLSLWAVFCFCFCFLCFVLLLLLFF